MFEYRGVQIKVTETTKYDRNGSVIEASGGRMFYVAESKHGLSLDGFSPQRALEGAKTQIDRALSK